MEPNYFWANFFFLVIPFGAYFTGIVIRRVAMPRKKNSPLSHQCLLGIPVALVVVSPLIPVLNATVSNVPGYLVTLGIIIEQGMLVNETIIVHLKTLLNKQASAEALPEAIPGQAN